MNNLLQKELNTNKISHAYLIESSNTETALESIKEFVCKLFNNDSLDNNPDFSLIIPIDKTLKIEQVRQMQKDLIIKPIKFDKKIFILHNADKMTEQSQNCILKTLEEPPEYAVIILNVLNSDKLIGTILSRVKKIKLDIKEEALVNYSEVERIINNIEVLSTYDLLKAADFFTENKDNILDILNYMLKYSEKKLYKSVLSVHEKNDNILVDRLVKIIEVVEKTINDLNRNCNFNMVIDNMLMIISEN